MPFTHHLMALESHRHSFPSFLRDFGAKIRRKKHVAGLVSRLLPPSLINRLQILETVLPRGRCLRCGSNFTFITVFARDSQCQGPFAFRRSPPGSSFKQQRCDGKLLSSSISQHNCGTTNEGPRHVLSTGPAHCSSISSRQMQSNRYMLMQIR